MQGLEGTRLGRYLLRERLGRGGMSEVYLATDELMHRDVAVKVVSSAQTEYVERFQREAEAIGNLQHDHILPAYDFGEQPPWYYLVMPYIGYCTLLDKLRDGPLPLDYAGELLTQIASGLQYAHDHGVLHRDIKPSNILMRDDHFVYLADFGLAKPVEGGDKLTQTGILMGTPEFMAPELADGPPSKSSDVYALGILLYQMVTGKMPFSGDNPLAVFIKQMREPPLPPSRVRPGIPHSIELVIMRALEKDPRRRYESPMALATAYMQALRNPAFAQETPQLSPFLPYETLPMGEDLLQRLSSLPHDPPRLNEVVPPMPALPVKPAVPSTPIPEQQPDKLVLPAYSPPPPPPVQAQHNASPETAVSQASPPRAAVASRRGAGRRPRRSWTSMIVLALVALVIIVAGIEIGYSISQNNHGQSNQPQSHPGLTQSAGTRVTPASQPSAQPSPGATLTAQAQATVQAIYQQATAVTSSTPLLSDSLSSNTNGRWAENSACLFQNNTYNVLVSQPGYLQPCSLNGSYTFGNCAIQVSVTLVRGSDAGFIFRVNGDQFYDFEINDQGQYYFRRHDANAGANYMLLVPSTSSSAIGSGTNQLMVIANGSDFRLFVNGTFVNEVQDSTYTSGQFSLVAGTIQTASNAEASFSSLNVYPVGG
jgi:serine/threonine protein kinase